MNLEDIMSLTFYQPSKTRCVIMMWYSWTNTLSSLTKFCFENMLNFYIGVSCFLLGLPFFVLAFFIIIVIVYLKCTRRSDATSHTQHENNGEVIDIEASKDYNGSHILKEKHRCPWKTLPGNPKILYRYSDYISKLSMTKWLSEEF